MLWHWESISAAENCLKWYEERPMSRSKLYSWKIYLQCELVLTSGQGPVGLSEMQEKIYLQLEIV